MTYNQEAFEQDMEQEMEQDMEQIGGKRARKSRSTKPRAKSPSKPRAKSPSKVAKATISSLKKIKGKISKGGIDLSPFLTSLLLLGTKLSLEKKTKKSTSKPRLYKKKRGGNDNEVDTQDKMELQGGMEENTQQEEQSGGRKARKSSKKPAMPKKRSSSPKPKKMTGKKH